MYKLILFAALAPIAACSSKTERLVRVQAARAPVLSELVTDGTPHAVLHPGDLVRVDKAASPKFAWKGRADEEDAARDGEVVEIRRARDDSPGYVFRGDLGGEVEVASAKQICERLHAGAQCPGRLRRIIVEGVEGPGGGALLAYEAAAEGPCKVALVRGDTVETLMLEAVGDLRTTTLNGQRVALATSRWRRSPVWTGTSTIVLRLEPRLARATEIVTDELDASHLSHRLRHGRLYVSPEGLRFVGEEQLTMQNGTDLSKKPLDETYRVSPAVAK